MKSDSAMSRTRLLRASVVLAVLLAGVAVSWYILTSAPKPKRVKPEAVARLVEVQPLTRASSRPFWPAGGEVKAAEQVALAAQVSGRVVQLQAASVPGTLVKKGTLLATLEAADFEYLLQQRQAALTQAQAQLQIEQGQAALAREEYSLAAQSLSEEERALVLREPQLASAEAQLATARAEWQQARLNLQRTRIVMPFDGQILARHISTGSQVNTSTALFDVVRTDRFWVEVKVPRTFLPLLDSGTPARLTPAGAGASERPARVLNVLPGVSSSDRQAVVLLEIEQPLSGPAPVLAGDYAEVALPGREFPDAVVIASRYLQADGGVWVVNNGQLQRRTPEVLFRGREQVWLGAGFEAADQLLQSRLDAPVPGMPVRVQEPQS